MKTVNFECSKYRMYNNADGTIRLTLDIHPDDIKAAMDVFSSRKGTRFMCALAEIDDDEQPKPEEKESVARIKSIGEKLHVMCSNKSFQKFMKVGSKDQCILALRISYDVESLNDVSKTEFDVLCNDYQDWLIPNPLN